jgi:hypothetical protein
MLEDFKAAGADAAEGQKTSRDSAKSGGAKGRDLSKESGRPLYAEEKWHQSHVPPEASQ